MNQAFSKIWIMVILTIVIIAVIAGGILTWQYFRTPKEEDKASEVIVKNETADWKTYQNEEHGFEIKHPKGLNPEIIDDISGDNRISLHFGGIFRMAVVDPDMEGHIRLYTIEGTERKILIDNIEGDQFHIADMAAEVASIPYTLVKNKGRLYVFVGEGEIFNQMLSTFRFLE